MRRLNPPTTSEVLEVISDIGIVVGSVLTATNPEWCKDVDVVLPIGNENFKELLYRWREQSDSNITGHLVIYATPVIVEFFEDRIGVLIKEETKRHRIRAYTTLRRKAVWKEIFGVRIRTSPLP